MAAPVADANWLNWMSKLMESSAAVEPRRIPGYCCVLDEQPDHLVPERLLRPFPRDQGEWSFNPRCYLSAADILPEPLRRLEESLAQAGDVSGPIAWVEDSSTGAWIPFWLGPALSEAAAAIRNDAAQIERLSPRLLNVLWQAGILVAEPDLQPQRQLWVKRAHRVREKFRQSGYASIGGLLHPFHIGALRRYYRRQIRKGRIWLGDDQSPRRYIAHNDPAARFFHLQWTKAVSELAGEPVKASYAYVAAYQSGAELEKHTDRPQCEFSVTLCLDYSPEPLAATPWPLYLENHEGTVTVYQALGDGLLYRGRELPHYRGRLRAGNTSTSIFFHYVAEDFAGALN
jgi:hypothetical protein